MERFVFKFFCVFYLAMVVNCRYISENSKNTGDIFEIGRTETAHKYKGNKEKATTEIEQILANINAKINNLKVEYSTEKYKTLLPKLDKVIYDYPRKTTVTKETTEDQDFIGTAQIEALLNDIKARAIQMVAEQNPSVTDMITNTVTEATFEADPVLTHLEVTSPGYALTTFVCLNNVDNIDKRTANESKNVYGDNKHSVSVRSVKENAYTIAQNVEEMLQKELKSIYNKVKEKVSKDFHKEVNTAKSSIKCHTSKIIDQVTKVGTKHAQITTHKTTTGSRHIRGNKYTKDLTEAKEETTAVPTIDDFAMLTLYEQILAKTHEDNVMKMLATKKKRKIDETIRLSKRNPETLTDITLKKDIKKMYDDGDNIPDVDYSNDMLPEANNDYPTDSSPAANQSSKLVRTESTPTEDTSYEGLSDKLAYKDYVNGFKDYLKFQRDEAKQNFSALIKYQAHKHHNVDDIGKFILNKIPQIPKRKRRHFFDDSDIDDQDISTKSDDSWFRKHFYMFIDNGPPKKYHTSETVEFRDVTEANKVEYPNAIEKPYAQGHHDTNNNLLGNVNLDELSRVLEDRKRFTSYLPYLNDDIIRSTPETRQIEESGFRFTVNAPKIISKFFGKRQKELENENSKDRSLKYDDENFLFNTDLTRLQRNAVKEISGEEESNETHTTLLNKQNAKTNKAKNNNAKVGCVSIVTQPTAIVNLLKSESKGGKVQRLLNKLHFHKRKKNHKKKKDKRHCTRVQRFNPLRKLKDMFTSKTNERVIGTNEQTDYDMMKAHIDTFKPVKYDKLPSVDELRIQVPNITGDNIAIQSETVQTDNEWSVKDDSTRFNKNSADAETSTAMYDYTLPSPRQFHYAPEKQQLKPKYTTRKFKKKLKINENAFSTDNIMNVNVKTLAKDKMDDIFTISPTVDDIRNELQNIQMTINPQNNKESPKIKGKLESQREEVGNVINEDNKDFDDITIKAKLTRVAKYPIHKFKHNKTKIKPTGGNSKLYEFADNDSYITVHEEAFPLVVTERNAPRFEQYQKINKYNVEMSPMVARTMKIIDEEPVTLKELASNYKKYPDYFHDLVRWNSDILGFDKVSVPTWQNILKGIQGADEYTTTNVELIQKELSEMNDHLGLYNTGRMKGKETENEKDLLQNSAASDIGSYITSNPKYVAKVKNIKVEVGNKINNKQTIRDYDEYLYNQKSYSNHKAQDIINVLNHLYTKQNSNGIKKGHSTCKNNQGALINIIGSNTAVVSTPTPTYDEMYFVDDTNSWVPKKLSKNSVKAPKSKHKESRPIAKVNKMPKQFYNTPLPMKSENFKKFLKENGLDVENLTSPIKDDDMPVITEKWHSKLNSPSKIMNTNKITNTNVKEKSKVTESIQKKGFKDDNNIDYKSYPENQIDYLNDLEQDLIDDNVKRQKRFNVNDYDSYKDSVLIDNEKIQDFKNKLSNFINKKPEEESESLDSVTDPNDDLEITIINFDDVDSENNNKLVTKPNSQELVKVNAKNMAKLDGLSTTKAKEKESGIEDKKTKLHQTLNNLKVDEKDANISDIASITEKSKDSQDLTMILEKSSDFKGKDSQGNLPKTFQISSISYKYDVVYNEPGKIVDRGETISNEHDEIDKSTPLTNAKEFGDNSKKNTNSEMDGVSYPKSRAARSVMTLAYAPLHPTLPSAKTTNTRRSTFSQTIHFTKMTPRSKRLFQIIPNLKEKLKKLGKKKSSTLSMKTKTMKETATTSLKVNATAIETSTGTTATYKTTKSNEREEVKFNYDNLFDYKLFTIDENRNAEIDAYNESSSDKTPADITTTTNLKSSTKSTNTEVNTYNKSKRDVNSGVHTAKEVAALEVIVDLMRNTLSYAETSAINTTPNNLNGLKAKTKMDQTTNSIQVHIAIPYDISNKKRDLDPDKVRKVFTAKLATPVDLEYQIHSVEDDIDTITKAADYGLSPGTYLLVNDANKAGYSFKPIEMPLEMKKDVTEKEEETKADIKVSKEFVAAVNKYLMQLYKNMTATNKNENKIAVRKVRDTRWDKIKQYFGHDRVCKCKCKANKPMCSTCAACDSVIKELVFEFENLAKYMSDHCTEIQTFFWMNPSSGRALRDTVHKIDKSLNDYYKRVKGKCSGCKCKTFATFIDKRGFKNKKVTRHYIGDPLLKDLKSLNDHLDISASFIPYDTILREKGDELLNAVNNCFGTKSILKRTESKRKCYDKDMYTLDNISVNIICNPDTPVSVTSPNTYHDKTVPITTTESGKALDYDIDKRNCKKFKPYLGKKIKPLLNNIFTYYVTQTEANILKREAKYNQIESPLIADTGGSFWRDYLNKGNAEQNNDYKTPDFEVSVVETNSEKTPTALSQLTFNDKLRNFRKSKTETTETTNQLVDTTELSYSYNMNELFKLINTIKVTEDQITFTDPTIVTHRNHTKHRTKKIKTKKQKKIHKTKKAKIHKQKTKTTKMLKAETNSNDSSNKENTIAKEITAEIPKTESTFASYNIEDTAPNKDVNEPKEGIKSTTKMNLFDKIRMATLGFLSNIRSGNSIQDTVKDEKLINTDTVDNKKASQNTFHDTSVEKVDQLMNLNTIDKKASKDQTNIISGATTQMNPTLIIINDENTIKNVKEKSKFRSILLSLLKFESSKIDQEKERLNNEMTPDAAQNLSHEDMEETEHTIDHKLQPKKTTPEADMVHSIQGMKPLELTSPPGPGLKPAPGLLERVAHQFMIKVGSDKVAATSTPNIKTTHQRLHSNTTKMRPKRFTSEETEPTKIMELNLNDRRDEFKELQTSSYFTNMENPLPRNSHKVIKSRDDILRETTQKSIKIYKTEFDSYVRNENGIYRLRRNNDSTNKRENIRLKRILQNSINDRFKRERKKLKRSNAVMKNSDRLSVWLHHSAGFFVATITCFYTVLATFAAVINWVFGT